MTAAAAKPRLRPEPKPGRLPIMFFGTIEVAWASSKDIVSWGQGIKDNLWSKNKHKNRQVFDLGFEQVPPATYTDKKLHWAYVASMAGSFSTVNYLHLFLLDYQMCDFY